MSVEELPNRNRRGINSVSFLCVMYANQSAQRPVVLRISNILPRLRGIQCILATDSPDKETSAMVKNGRAVLARIEIMKSQHRIQNHSQPVFGF